MTKIDKILSLSKELRQNETVSEKLLWNKLRRKQLGGLKFLRQHAILYNIKFDNADFFIADFYCAELNLIIEVDGEIHNYQKDYDSSRTDQLELLGYTVIRFRNSEVEYSIDAVLTSIEDKIMQLR